MLENCKESLDKNEIVVATFLDSRRVFEKIDRTMLLNELECNTIKKEIRSNGLEAIWRIEG